MLHPKFRVVLGAQSDPPKMALYTPTGALHVPWRCVRVVTPYFMVLVTPLGVTISIKGWLHPIYDGFGLYTQRQLRRGFLNFLSSAGAILIGEFLNSAIVIGPIPASTPAASISNLHLSLECRVPRGCGGLHGMQGTQGRLLGSLRRSVCAQGTQRSRGRPSHCWAGL